jgi:predicted Zn-dependent protease with MMP-like domain
MVGMLASAQVTPRRRVRPAPPAGYPSEGPGTRPKDGWGYPARGRLYRARFERLVDRALRQLPGRWSEKLDNVAIVVADRPTAYQRAAAGVGPDDELYGLYEGIPQPQRPATYGMVLPDRITIFQRSIEADCRSEAEIVAEVRHTIVHELAHHFGIDDARLEELGFD